MHLVEIFSFHEIYVQIQPNQLVAKDLNTGRAYVENLASTSAVFTNEFAKFQDLLVKAINVGSSFSFLKKRVIIHWQIEASVEANKIAPKVCRACDVKDLLLCTDKEGDIDSILKLAPWRSKR